MTITDKILQFDKYFIHKKVLDDKTDRGRNADLILRDGGTALEINLVPQKHCPGDCLYCPYKATTKKTVDRESYYPVNKILKKITGYITGNHAIKQISLTGCGETTLNADLFPIIRQIKTLTDAEIIVKTCGSLLWRESVRHDIMNADVVHVHIDAADKTVYKNINRYLLQIPYERYIDGIIHFRQIFKGDLIVNVTLLDGINTELSHLQRLSSLIQYIDPTNVIIRTINDPEGPKRHNVDMNRLLNFASCFGQIASVQSNKESFPCLPGAA